MMNIVFLHHPNSKLLINQDEIDGSHNIINLNLGMTNGYKSGLRESSDFFPNYASYNSVLFESSSILTLWEHSDDVFKDGPIVISHTDVIPRFLFSELESLAVGESFAIGTTVPSYSCDKYKTLVIDDDGFKFRLDPWHISDFDGVIDIWELIRQIDKEVYEFAFDTNPTMIYSHQFCVSRDVFEKLGEQLCNIAMSLRLSQCGLWTAHVFERIIAVRLAMMVKPILTSMFSHYTSSSPKGPGELTLYGPRAYKYFKMFSKALK